jgi:hypothetical protein
MNSKQGSRYIKKRMGNDLKNKILEYNGICVDPYVRNKIIVLEFIIISFAMLNQIMRLI